MTETITTSYEGPVRVYLPDGAILTTGQAQLADDPEMATWTGTLQVLAGTAVDGKALIVLIEIPDGEKGRAQLVPLGRQGDRAYSKIIGLGQPPF
ncbi:MAG TPA: hypothetical protein VKZ47_07725 [Acidimicrobiia bacterium]|jgi:hypothetical protein|nr:hypothetical protein [Acidimicrobiia bacterium]